MSVFRAYDIRGQYPKELNELLAYRIAVAYAEFLRPKKVVIGRDLRKSSSRLHDAFVTGLIDAGVEVVSIGACTTPMLYFASFHYRFDGAVMITASHLPGMFNGIKLCRERAIPLSGPDGIYHMEKLVSQTQYTLSSRRGHFSKKDIEKDYHKFIARFAKKTSLKIVVDCGNGMGYLDVALLKRFANTAVLYGAPDMSFPNHLADPNKKESRTAIVKLMKEHRFDLGIILDGDCDRVGFVDEKANFIPMDHVTGMLAHHFIRRKHPRVVYEVRTTLAVPQMIRREGGSPVLSKAGHAFIKETMIKHDAVFGGEKTGHYFFRDFHYADNALLAAVIMINYIHDSKKPCSQLAKEFKRYEQIEETNFIVKNKDLLLKKMEAYFKKTAKGIKKLDGISVYLKNGWFNMRQSNTEQLVRLNAEAATKKELDKIMGEVKKLVRKWSR